MSKSLETIARQLFDDKIKLLKQIDDLQNCADYNNKTNLYGVNLPHVANLIRNAIDDLEDPSFTSINDMAQKRSITALASLREAYELVK